MVYSAEPLNNPFVGGMDITNFSNRTSYSSLSFSEDLLTLTIDNVVQARILGEETDRGRYIFLSG